MKATWPGLRHIPDEGIMVNSGAFNGMDNKKAMEEIADYLEKHNLGKREVSFRLRDWGISRQRYWGAPIPMIHCDRLRHCSGAGKRSAGDSAGRCGSAGRRRISAAGAGIIC